MSTIASVVVDRLAGIYLPLLHPLSSCCRYPVVVCLERQTGSFQPLVTTRPPPVSPDNSTEMVIPLCSSDLEPLEVRCLLDSEKPGSLLEMYLRVTEVPCTRADGIVLVPAARFVTLAYIVVKFEEINLMFKTVRKSQRYSKVRKSS